MLTEREVNALHLMQSMGGSFVAALATAWLKADLSNQAKLKATFPEYLERYAVSAERRATK